MEVTGAIQKRSGQDELLQVYSNENLNKHLKECFITRPLRLNEIVEREDKSLHECRMEYGECDMVKLISLFIFNYLTFINCKESMDNRQIKETAQLLIDTFPHAPITLIATFFQNAKTGLYGETYNRMDGSILLGWFRKFYYQWEDAVEEKSYQEHLQLKSGGSTHPIEIGKDTMTYQEYLKTKGIEQKNELLIKEIQRVRHEITMAHREWVTDLPIEDAQQKVEDAVVDELISRGIFVPEEVLAEVFTYKTNNNERKQDVKN